MEKSVNEDIKNVNKPTRRSPRTGPSQALLDFKRSMKQKSEERNCTNFIKDDYETAQNVKHQLRGETGLACDDEFTRHVCVWDNHPESPTRYTAIIKRINELGLSNRCKKIQCRYATKEELLEIHDLKLLELLKSTCEEDSYDAWEEMSSKFDSIYVNKWTYDCAALAAGTAINLIDSVCSNAVYNGMAVIRPPGHHAMRNEFCGYCFFNNAALAANHAVKKFGLDRVLIVDWDVHHGQGIQQIFYDDPRVIYFSIHRYDSGNFWPELREGEFDCIGEGSGRGFNFNVPINATHATDADYLAIFHQILLPMAYQYESELIIICGGYDAAIGCPELQPKLIIVSAGYDSAIGDEKVNYYSYFLVPDMQMTRLLLKEIYMYTLCRAEGEMQVSPACFAHLVTLLMGLAQGKVAVLLEGGYCIESLAEGAALTLRALLGDPVPSLYNFGQPSDTVVTSILNVLYVQRPFWKCFQLQEAYSIKAAISDLKDRKTIKKTNLILPSKKKFWPMLTYKKKEIQKPAIYPTRQYYPVLPPEIVEKNLEKLNLLKSKTDWFLPPNRVALIYSDIMTEHESLSSEDHPEKPERISHIFKRHEEFNLLGRCKILQPRSATRNELLLVHDENYINEIEKTSDMTDDELAEKSDAFDSVYFNRRTYNSALISAGCLLQVVDEVVRRKCASGVAIVRPPGHHAESASACGFCLFNNVCVAAKYAIETYELKRILLLDWDIHHGNGTQHIFESDDRVLYISLHRYNNGKFFPGSTDANYDKIGIGRGKGFNVNIPWNKPGGGMTDGDYIAAFHSVILPIAYEYNPELVLVSAGFDACIHDPLGNCKVTPEAYAHMTYWLTTLANGKVILSLEGGYNLVSISYAMTLCTKALLGDPLPPLTSSIVPSASALETLKNVLNTQEKYWKCLRFNWSLPTENVFEENVLEKVMKEINGEEANGIGDSLAETLKKLSISPRTPQTDTNFKPEDANERGPRENQRRLPERESDGENASGSPGLPTLVEYLSENMQRLLNEEMFAVVPLSGCPHLVEVQAVPPSGINVQTPCGNCETDQENWICLVCYAVFCGRYVNQHMVMHNEETNHPLTLSFTDISVWCYVCEAYIDNMVLYAAKNAVHRSKFGRDLQWNYGSDGQPPSAGSE